MKNDKLNNHIVAQMVGQLMTFGLIGAALLIMSKCSADKVEFQDTKETVPPVVTDSIPKANPNLYLAQNINTRQR